MQKLSKGGRQKLDEVPGVDENRVVGLGLVDECVRSVPDVTRCTVIAEHIYRRLSESDCCNTENIFTFSIDDVDNLENLVKRHGYVRIYIIIPDDVGYIEHDFVLCNTISDIIIIDSYICVRSCSYRNFDMNLFRHFIQAPNYSDWNKLFLCYEHIIINDDDARDHDSDFIDLAFGEGVDDKVITDCNITIDYLSKS